MIQCSNKQGNSYSYYCNADKVNGYNDPQRKWGIDMKSRIIYSAFISEQDTIITIVNRDLLAVTLSK